MHGLASAPMSVQHHLLTLIYPTSSECVLEIEVDSWFKIILRFVLLEKVASSQVLLPALHHLW